MSATHLYKLRLRTKGFTYLTEGFTYSKLGFRPSCSTLTHTCGYSSISVLQSQRSDENSILGLLTLGAPKETTSFALPGAMAAGTASRYKTGPRLDTNS